MRQVETKPADFLKSRFAVEAAARMIRRRLPALLLALLLPLGAAAQDDAAPKVEVTVDPPDGGHRRHPGRGRR